MQHFMTRKIITLLCASGLIVLSQNVMAAAFQLWEQDGASVGNYHAGYAAIAEDASTAFYNPAGITRFDHQQIVFAGIGIITDFKFKGTIQVFPISDTPMPTTAQGGNFSFLPALHYVTPLTDKLGFGFSIDVPFGLKTNYGYGSPARYASTQSAVTVVDISPSFAYRVTEKGSLGLGLDIQRMYAEFDQVGGAVDPSLDSVGTNKANDTGYGYHLGGLYEFTPETRVGLSYHSQVVHHLNGSSKFVGPLADLSDFNGPFSSHANTNVTLPAYTALSTYHRLCPKFAMMGTVIYTQWNTFKNLVLNNVSGIEDFSGSQNIQVTVPQYYRNSWNLALGANYYATDRATLRGGLGYDQSPVSNAYRNLPLPDTNRYVIALGGHYQASKAIGVDIGWLHIFVHQTRVNPPPQVTGDQITTTSGNVTGGADVYSGQITWDIA